MLQPGSSFTASTKIGDLQVSYTLFGDTDKLYEACFSCTVSNATMSDPDNKDTNGPMGLNSATLQTVKGLTTMLNGWLGGHSNKKFHRFANEDVIYTKLIELFKKAGYSFK